MRKRIVGLGAAAVLIAGGTRGDVRQLRADAVKQPGVSTPLSRLPFLQQGTIVATMFVKARTVEQYREAEEVWTALRPRLSKYETSLSCKDYGASHDKDIAVEIVEDLIKPLELMVDVGKLLLAIAGQEKDGTLDALKEAARDLVKFVAEDKLDKVMKTAENASARARVVERFKDALLKYLQSRSKRSRQHYLQVISDITAVAKSYGRILLTTARLGDILMTPSRINPEECGTEEWIERERSAALTRVFSSQHINVP